MLKRALWTWPESQFNLTGTRRPPQLPGFGSKCPAILKPQAAQRFRSSFHSPSTYPSRSIRLPPQPGHQVTLPS